MKNRNPNPMKNMSLMTVSLTSAAFLLPILAFAGGDKGHGGRGTVCFGDYDPQLKRRKVLSTTLLDYDEAVLGSWTVDLGADRPGTDDVPEMIQVALARLKKRDRLRAEALEKKVAEVASTWVPLDLDKNRQELAIIADAEVLVSPSEAGCIQKQLAFNKVDPGFREHKYAYVKQFVEKMSDRDRAGLILHEALYNLEASAGATNSDGVRKQVLAMSSKEFEAMTLAEYVPFIESNSVAPTVTALNGTFQGKVKYQGEYVTSGRLSGRHEYSGMVFNGKFIPGKLVADLDPEFKDMMQYMPLMQFEFVNGIAYPLYGTWLGTLHGKNFYVKAKRNGLRDISSKCLTGSHRSICDLSSVNSETGFVQKLAARFRPGWELNTGNTSVRFSQVSDDVVGNIDLDAEGRLKSARLFPLGILGSCVHPRNAQSVTLVDGVGISHSFTLKNRRPWGKFQQYYLALEFDPQTGRLIKERASYEDPTCMQ